MADAQLQEIIDVLRNIEKNGPVSAGGTSGGTGGSSSSTAAARSALSEKARELRIQKEMNHINDDAVKTYKRLYRAVNDTSKNYDEAAEILEKKFTRELSALDFRNLKQLPSTMSSMLAKTEHLSNQKLETEEDVLKFMEKKKKQEAKVARNLKLLGLTIEQAREKRLRSVKVLDEYNDVLVETSAAMTEVNSKRKSSLSGFVNSLKESGEKLRKFGQIAASATAPALKFGTNLSSSLTAFEAGMDPAEMAKHLADNRRTMNAMGTNMDAFREQTEKGTFELTAWTGELQDSVKLQAQAIEMGKRFGTGDMADFMEGQVRSFKKFHDTFSMTTEEFMAMNKQIKESQSINAQIYKMDVKRRAGYLLDTQNTIARLKIDGLAQEQAMKVVEAMAQIGAQSPKERMKQAAKMQAVGGALGFGAEAAEAAKLMRRGFRQEGDKARFADLQKVMQKATGQFMNQGFGQEMMASQMIEATGIGQLLGPESAFQALNTEQTMAIKDVGAVTRESNTIAGSALATQQSMEKLLEGPVIEGLRGAKRAAEGIYDLMVAGALMKGGFMDEGKGKGKLGRFTKLRSAAGLGSAASLAGAAYAGWEIGTMIDETWAEQAPDSHKAMQKGVGGLVADVVGIFNEDIAKLNEKEEIRHAGHMEMMKGGEVNKYSKDYGKLTKEQRNDTWLAIAKSTEDLKKSQDEYRKSDSDDREQRMINLEKEIQINEALLQKLEEIDNGIKEGNKKVTEKLEEGNKDRQENHKDSMDKKDNAVNVTWARTEPAR